MAAVATWIVIGGANRIAKSLVDDAPDRNYGVTPDEAFKMIATEWGRHVRYYAAGVVRAWESQQ